MQLERMGCGIACAAMVSGLSYPQVRGKLAGNHPKRDLATQGLDDLIMPQLLRACGVAAVITYPYDPLLGKRRPDWPTVPEQQVLILCVQNELGAHYVVQNRQGQILDPSYLKPRTLGDYSAVHYYLEIFPIVHV